jgi:hypothetical protein
MFFCSGGPECQAINPSNFGLNLRDITGFLQPEILSYYLHNIIISEIDLIHKLSDPFKIYSKS